MGYTTDFAGQFKLDEPLREVQVRYLNDFNETRRMKRDSSIAETLPDPVRKAVGLPIGEEGEYFVGNTEDFGQTNDKSVINHNEPPVNQPGLWCKWKVSEEDNSIIEWDGAEKFYAYVEWIEYIIEHFLKPWGHNLNGEIEFQGEDMSDRGKIIVKNNEVSVKGISYD